MSSNKTKILVVDDLTVILEHFKWYFERRNFEVLTVASAEEALPIIKENNPDIILLDINLPKMSGIDLLKLVRKFNQTVKVIMVSGYNLDAATEALFQELGVLQFIPKPVELSELELTIKKALTLI